RCREVAVEVRDSIEREVILPVPPARVWTALTQADQLSAWFGTQATIDLRPGGEVIFTWDGSTGPVGTSRGVIEAVEPPKRFAFRWQSVADDVPMTRVEFTLEPHPEGTRLCLVESGFASLPPELRGGSHGRNTEGWQRELGELSQYLAVR
ncbi:MAG TPA: SRPBCC domain-containing protein, partial [Chloroflexota bacterium]|nr:SRPBCC domain-containing protein [Chloroflexota bacterium]